MDFGTASLLEIGWTGLAAVSLLLWVGAVVTAIRDGRAIRTRPSYQRHGPRAAIIRGRLWSAVLDALVQLAFMLIGVGAMLTPPATRPINQEQAVRAGLLFILIELLLLVKTVVVRASRAQTDRALDRRAREKA